MPKNRMEKGESTVILQKNASEVAAAERRPYAREMGRQKRS